MEKSFPTCLCIQGRGEGKVRTDVDIICSLQLPQYMKKKKTIMRKEQKQDIRPETKIKKNNE